MIRNEALEHRPLPDPTGSDLDHDPSRWQPLLSVDEERELAERIKGGDQGARKQLILANLRLVAGIVRRYKSSKLPFDDLAQEGNLGLIRASEDFDPSVHGCRFYTYAEIWIKAFIHRALITNDSLVRIPLHVFQRRKRHRQVMAMTGDAGMSVEGGVEAQAPSVEELARKIRASPRRRKSVSPATYEMDCPRPFDDMDDIMSLTDMAADTPPPDEDAVDHEQRLLLEVALRRLNPVEAWVIQERYGLGTLIPNEMRWPHSKPPAGCRDDSEGAPDPVADTHGPRRAYYHRSYTDLGRDCGLSHYRILQVEEAALEKLRDVLRPWLRQAV